MGGRMVWPVRAHPARDGMLAALVILVSAFIPLAYLWHQSSHALMAELKRSLEEMAVSSATLVDGDLHEQLVTPAQEDEALYQGEVAKIRRFMGRSPRIAAIYTVVLRDGSPRFVIDTAAPGDRDGDGREDHSFIMEEVASPGKAMLKSLAEGVSSVDEFPVARNGALLMHGYAPFRNRRDELVGVVGVAVQVDPVMVRVSSIRRAAYVGTGLAAVISLGIGFGIWRLGVRTLYARREVSLAEEARNIAESRYQQLFEQTPIGVMYYGKDMRITHCNQQLVEIIQSQRELLVGLDLNSLRDIRVLPALQAALDGEIGNYVGPYRSTLSNREMWIQILCGPVRDTSGEVVGGIATIEDTTARHRTEVMSDTEKYLLGMITRNEDLSQILNRLVLDIESMMPGALCSILYISEDGKHLARGVSPSLPDEYTRLIHGEPVGPKNGSCGTAMHENRMVITPDIQSDPLWEDYRHLAARFDLRACWSKPIHSSRGGILGTFAIYHREVFIPSAAEIALLERAGYIAGIAVERSRHSEELSRERNLLRTLIENLSDVIFIKDKHHCYLAANAAAARYLGVAGEDDLVGKTDFDLFPAATAAISQQIEKRVLAGSPDINQESTIINVAGDAMILSFSRMPLRNETGEMIGLVVIGRNVTDQHHVEEERIKTQKLESLGLLAGGIAHDFNNILTSILGNVAMIKQSNDGVLPENAELITEAEHAVLRARELTQQLLTFAKGGMPVKRPADAGRVVTEAARFAVRGSASRIELEIPGDLWIADIDSGQISQVVQNLVLNADQAMPQGGTITITARNVELRQANRFTLPTGSYISISVKDAGVGIPEKNLNKIFDPYFSTKPAGNGLGLTTSFSIIKKHGGNIIVQSEEEKGSTFTFLLPALPGRKLIETEVDGAPVSTRNARILIMDDEEAILKITSRMLERCGFQVMVARHGEEAFLSYREAFEHGTPFDLVILDLTIPGGMGGKETFDRLRDFDPSVKAIVSSGYSMDEIMARHEMFGFTGVVTKPYHRDDLINAVNQALGDV